MMFSYLFSGHGRLRAARAILERIASVLDARICVRLWDGSLIPLGRDADPNFVVAISGPGVISSLLRWPTLDNFVQHYAAGRIDFQGGDLIAFAELARVPNSNTRLRGLSKWWLLRKVLPFVFFPSDRSVVEHRFEEGPDRRACTRNNKKLIQFHYDVGNEFYQLFLDSEMQYSCAYFTDWGNSLEQAQHDKLEMICRKLRLRPGESLLDVGCGWGGLICHAAQQYGVRAHGVTLSEQQLEFTREKIRRLGLQDLVTVELRDYRELDGTYDKIASIGMFEHVGSANYPAYFGKLYGLLRDRGILLNHAIFRAAKSSSKKFKKVRAEQRFIQDHIFPGSDVGHIGHTLEVMEGSRFEIHDIEGWREHYARTTRFWCQRLSARRAEAERLVGPERYRLWVAYLAGASFAFADGSLRLFQVLASKRKAKGPSEMPPTRQDLYTNVAPTTMERRSA